jgi:hypothetical protein
VHDEPAAQVFAPPPLPPPQVRLHAAPPAPHATLHFVAPEQSTVHPPDAHVTLHALLP